MKLGIFAKTFKFGNIDGIFAKIRQHGLGYIHYNMACSGLPELPLQVPADKIDEIKAHAGWYQLEVVGLSATFNMIDRDPSVRTAGLKSLQALAPVARDIGTNFISLCTGSKGPDKWEWHPDNATPTAWNELLQTMEQAVRIAEQYQILLGVEPEMGNVVRNPGLARRLLDEMASDRLRIILDPANLFERAKNRQQIKDLVREAVDLLYDDIEIAHAKDRSIDGTIQPAGKGDVDFPFLIKELARINFHGPLIVHGLDEAEVGSTVSFLRNLV